MHACCTKTYHLNGSSCLSYLLPSLEIFSLSSQDQDHKLRDRHQGGDESMAVQVQYGMVQINSSVNHGARVYTGNIVDTIRLRWFVTSRMGFAPSVLSDSGACLVKCRAMLLAAAVIFEHWQTGKEVG